MLAKLDRLLSAQSGNHIVLLALCLVAVIAVIDQQTRNELSFSVFYTVPIGIASWYAGRAPGFFICCVCSITWFFIDDLAGSLFSNLGFQIWNAVVRLTILCIISGLVSRLRQVLDAYAGMARRDGLTGILNSRGFKEESQPYFKLAGRNGSSLTLGYLDLDGFKSINDRFGHSIGDQVIRTIAETLQKHMRASDRCARIGGDEFSILLPETDLEGAQVFFAGLKARLTELVAQHDWSIGFSFGVVVLDPPIVEIDEAIRQADEQMYNVKRSGKNNILFRSSSGQHEVREPVVSKNMVARGCDSSN